MEIEDTKKTILTDKNEKSMEIEEKEKKTQTLEEEFNTIINRAVKEANSVSVDFNLHCVENYWDSWDGKGFKLSDPSHFDAEGSHKYTKRFPIKSLDSKCFECKRIRDKYYDEIEFLNCKKRLLLSYRAILKVLYKQNDNQNIKDINILNQNTTSELLDFLKYFKEQYDKTIEGKKLLKQLQQQNEVNLYAANIRQRQTFNQGGLFGNNQFANIQQQQQQQVGLFN